MGADGKMDVELDVSKANRVSRLEVIEGPTGRRNRSAAEKARIAAESRKRFDDPLRTRGWRLSESPGHEVFDR